MVEWKILDSFVVHWSIAKKNLGRSNLVRSHLIIGMTIWSLKNFYILINYVSISLLLTKVLFCVPYRF